MRSRAPGVEKILCQKWVAAFVLGHNGTEALAHTHQHGNWLD